MRLHCFSAAGHTWNHPTYRNGIWRFSKTSKKTLVAPEGSRMARKMALLEVILPSASSPPSHSCPRKPSRCTPEYSTAGKKQ